MFYWDWRKDPRGPPVKTSHPQSYRLRRFVPRQGSLRGLTGGEFRHGWAAGAINTVVVAGPSEPDKT
jgi:hypothetical protein